MTKAPRPTTSLAAGAVYPHHIYTSGIFCQETPTSPTTGNEPSCTAESIPNSGCTSKDTVPESGQYFPQEGGSNEGEYDIHRWEDEGGSLGRTSFNLALVNNGRVPLSADLLKIILAAAPEAQMRNWNSVIDRFPQSTPDVVVAVSDNSDMALRQIEEIWSLRAKCNYSPRPIYFALCRTRQSPWARYEIERRGAHFLCLCDVQTRFAEELEQVRLNFGPLSRSVPRWMITYEGNGETLRVHIDFLHRRKKSRVPGSDRQIAALAVFIKHNGIHRSFSDLRKLLKDDLLFEPAGGGFAVPTIGTLKMWFKRDFAKNLQRAFDEYQSGFSATRVIEHLDPNTHNAKHKIRGDREVIRR